MTRPWQATVSKSFTPATFQEYMDEYVSNLSGPDWVPDFVVVHNTAIPRYNRWHKGENGLLNIRALEAYYRWDQKWSAGPHLFVADLIWVFTPLTVPGVHSPSWNGVAWGVETVGDYDKEPFVDPVRENLISALKSMHGALGADPVTMKFHREDPLTTHKGCPGANIHKPELVRLVAERL
jgi:hypothetical protein